MKLFSLPSLLISLATLTLVYCQTCTRPLQRREWRTLNDGQKRDYINAVLCMQSRPSFGYYRKARTRFDDFQAMHQTLTDEIHQVAQFLPHHRGFIHVWEEALRRECGYRGALPYWNWSIDVDAGQFERSPIFDPRTGFGGNGANQARKSFGPFNNLTKLPDWDPNAHTGGGCVRDGPFAHYILNIGPGTLRQPHCLTRGFNPSTFSGITGQNVADTLTQYPFENFSRRLEGNRFQPGWETHDGGHLAVGGEMSNVYSSPGDVLFYSHHAMLDSMWAKWQAADPADRLYQVSGPTVANAQDSPQITLDFIIKFPGLARSVTVRDLMDTQGGYLCYTYV